MDEDTGHLSGEIPDPGRPAKMPMWLRSPYGGHRHAFWPEKIKPGEFAEAVCEHSVPAEKLKDEEAEYCLLCSLFVIDYLAGLKQQGDTGLDWRMG